MIEVRNVTKRYGPTIALDDVSFSLDRGQILGFLGPNGAGKSTAMKIITTFLAPDSGTVTVDGIDVQERPLGVRSRIGYLPETNPLYVDMLVMEYLEFVGRARGLDGATLRDRLDWVVDACGLERHSGKAIHELSKGFKQRTGLAQALIHDPDILILDEPTSGLDPLQIIGIRELIQGLADTKTIIFSTHILQEVRPVTDRIVIINDGRLVADGHISSLEQEAMERNRIFVGVRAPAADAAGVLSGVSGVADVTLLGESEGDARFEVRADFADDVRAPLGAAVRDKGWDLLELHESRFTLEDTFIELTKRAGGSREVRHG